MGLEIQPTTKVKPGENFSRRRRLSLPPTKTCIPKDGIEHYMEEIAQYPLLTGKEEIEVARRIKLGKEADLKIHTLCPNSQERMELEALVDEGQLARRFLGSANTRLVMSIAKRYVGQGLSYPDLVQEGNVGLMRAVDKFEYERGNRFSSYAVWWIRHEMTRAIAYRARTIHVPPDVEDCIRAIYKTSQTLVQELGHEPSLNEIALRMELPEEKVVQLLNIDLPPVSLEKLIGDEGDNEFGNSIEDRDSPNPVESTTHSLLKEAVGDVLDELSPCQQKILCLHFGLKDQGVHTLEEIGEILGLSHQRVGQIQKEGLRLLRDPSRVGRLRDFF